MATGRSNRRWDVRALPMAICAFDRYNGTTFTFVPPPTMTYLAQLPDDASDAQVANATNEDLLEAVRGDDPHAALRAMEQGWGAWLGSSLAQNNDPLTNPVLMAITTPGSQRCLDAMQAWSSDVSQWTFDRWAPIHWAVACRNEDGVAWALKHGASVLDQERKDSAMSVHRSALALAAQMGDPYWLAIVLDLAVHAEPNMDLPPHRRVGPPSMDKLVRQDARHKLPAMTVVLHEMAEQDRRTALGAEDAITGNWDGCLAVLRERGFRIDRTTTVTAKLTCALALHTPNDPALAAYQRATLLAATLGSGWSANHQPDEGEREPVKLFEAAGEHLDTDWREALLLIGLQEGPEHGVWAVGASRELRRLMSLNNLSDVWSPARQSAIVQALQASLQAVPVAPHERAMRGYEEAFINGMSAARTQDEQAIWIERLDLADVALHQGDDPAPIGRVRSRL